MHFCGVPVLKGKEDPGHIRFFILNPWVDEHILEVTDKVGGKVSDTSQIRISANGKALTMTKGGGSKQSVRRGVRPGVANSFAFSSQEFLRQSENCLRKFWVAEFARNSPRHSLGKVSDSGQLYPIYGQSQKLNIYPAIRKRGHRRRNTVEHELLTSQSETHI